MASGQKTKNPNELAEDTFFGNAFDNLPIGALIVARNMTLIYANKAVSECFYIRRQNDTVLPLSHVFRCGIAEGVGPICGFTPKCKKCSIRKLISDVYETKIPCGSTELKCASVKDAKSPPKWYRVSGNPIVFEERKYALLSFEDITEFKQRETQLLKRLRLDMATETLNKFGLMEYISKLVNPEKTHSFTICMTDFDDFKRINDLYGHTTGDKVLNTFSEISRKIIRSSDIIGRYGGEEFIFVFMDTDLKSASNIIYRIQTELSKYFTATLMQPVTFSAGLMYVGVDLCREQEYQGLIDQVDKLLYKAKQFGKNCIVTADNLHSPVSL